MGSPNSDPKDLAKLDRFGRARAVAELDFSSVGERYSRGGGQRPAQQSLSVGLSACPMAYPTRSSATPLGRSLGCDPTRVVETGNTKFDGATGDREDPEVLRRREELNLRPDDVVWLCGSTQSPEEQLCLDAYRRLGPQYPHLKLILVPRHAERFDEVANEVAGTKLPWLRRSEMSVKAKGDGSSAAWKTEDWKIFLADSVGELRWWWGLADIGFVGGSFGSRGGQNMIEPCAYGVATSFGPNTRNFADVVQLLLEGGAAVQLVEPPSLETWVRQMVEHPSERQEIAAKARQVTSEHRGAIDRTWKALSVLLPESKLPNRSPNG